MLPEERKYWIAFSSFPGIGPKRFELLVKYFGSAENAWKSSEKELKGIGLPEKITLSFCNFRKKFSIENYLKWISREKINIITSSDSCYPALLKEISDPPFVLYIKSNIFSNKLFQEICIAVVGSRKLTSYGQEVTENLVSGLVTNGCVVVSGLARGVDSIAHKEAIRSGGKTIAVLGTGVNIVYPPENSDLYKNVINNGAVISEFPLGYPPLRMNFPARNRIISGLSLGVLITEAAKDSGSLITASFAGEQGREVFAVPGPITSSVSFGTSELIKKGAKLVTSIADIFEELNIKNFREVLNSKKILPTSSDEKIVLDILSSGQLHINDIIKNSRLPVYKVGSLLTIMEMKGMIRNYGNMIYGII